LDVPVELGVPPRARSPKPSVEFDGAAKTPATAAAATKSEEKETILVNLGSGILLNYYSKKCLAFIQSLAKTSVGYSIVHPLFNPGLIK